MKDVVDCSYRDRRERVAELMQQVFSPRILEELGKLTPSQFYRGVVALCRLARAPRTLPTDLMIELAMLSSKQAELFAASIDRAAAKGVDVSAWGADDLSAIIAEVKRVLPDGRLH
jgi:hypothetical protein